MDRFEQLVAETKDDYVQHILGNPLLRQLASGPISRDQYASYLAQTFHLVRHTSRTLALAAGRLGDESRGLRAWFIRQADEEHGHEQFCVKDLRHLGFDPDQKIAEGPGPGAWGLFTQNYYMASYGNPVGMLGVATATEGMGASLAGNLAQILVAKHGIPENAVTFLKSHAGFDQAHLEEAKRAVIQYATSDSAFSDVVFARRMTFRCYGQLFSDVAAKHSEGQKQSVAA